MIDPNNYVRVTQYTNSDIVGRYGGQNYTFPDSHDGAYLDVEKIVALHCFGYGGTEQAKVAAIIRLGWTNRMSIEEARKQLDECVAFHDVPPFPASIAEFRRSRDQDQVSGVPHSPESDSQRAGSPASVASPAGFSPYEGDKKKHGNRR